MANKKQESAYAQLTGFKRAVPIILAAIAVFVGLCFFMQDTGALGKVISSLLLGLFSVGGYLIPVLLVLHAVFYARDLQKKTALSRLIFSIITVITFSALMHTIANFNTSLGFESFSAKRFYRDGCANKGGGFIGGAIAVLLTEIVGKVGLIIIAVLIFAIYVTFFFAGGKAAISRFLLKILNGISAFFTSKKKKNGEQGKKVKQDSVSIREKRRREELREKQEMLLDDEFFAADNGMQELVISELGIKETRNSEDIERDPTLQDKVFHKSSVEDSDAPKASGRTSEYRPFTDTGAENTAEDVRTSYGRPAASDDIIYEVKEEPSYTANIHNDFKADDSADDVFTSGFDAFDLKVNEELMNKPSSKAKVKAEESEGIREFNEPITEISEEDVEKARQKADFEMKKRAAMDAQRRYAEARAEEEAARRAREEEAASREEKAFKENIYTMYRSEPRTPYVPEYMVEDVEQTEPDDQPIGYKASFEDAIYDYEREKDGTFKEYGDTEIAEEDEYGSTDSPLTVERTMLDPSPVDYEREDGDDVYENEAEPTESEVFDFEEDDGEEYVSAEEGEIFNFDDEDDTTPIPEDEQNEDVKKYRSMFSFLNGDEEDIGVDNAYDVDGESEEGAEDDDGYYTEDEDEAEVNESEDDEEDKPPFEPAPAAKLFFEKMQEKAKPKSQPAKEPEIQEKPDYSDYRFPPLELLKKSKVEEDLDQEEEMNQNADKLVDALAQFNVRISIKGIDRGPRITRYEIVPARGVKVQSVTNLFNDIALYLGAEGIRMEAPIPGKSAIGVEIPNKKASTVLLRDLVERDEFIYSESKTNSCLGKDVTGNPVFADISKMPHVLVAGATGMGKSVCINAILISILYKARPDEVKFIMIDPKKVEFKGYNGIPHLLIPVVTDVKQAAGALLWAVEQMEKRYDLMEALDVRKIDSYNEKVRNDPSLGEPLPKIIIVIDELNDIMLQVRKPAEDLIMSIAQKARAAGIHLIIGTQRPSVDVITGVIKANIPSRISCKVASYNDSKTILEQAGAEKLLNNGDMLYIPSGAPKALRVQGAFVSDDEVNAIMKFLKAQAKGNVYDAQALDEINKAAQKCSKSKGGDDFDDDDEDGGDNVGVLNDQQFLDAVELAVKSGKISTSLIQRKISIGYGKAAKFIDFMEEMGIVSEPNGQRPRDVLITRDEWHEMLARRSLD